MSGPHWLLRPLGAPLAVRAWLTAPGSLTRRLQARCRTFEVRGVRHQWQRMHIDEARLVGLPPRRRAWRREVELHCDGVPVIFAQSVFPEESLRGAWRGLNRLGASPLGALLFADPRVRRTRLCYCRLNRHHSLFRAAAALHGGELDCLYARRSVFHLGRRRILVTEVFLPRIAELVS